MAIALIGRPNVGKSSLFNRLVGRRQSLVWNRAGVTRDIVRTEWMLDPSRPPVELWDFAGWGKFGVSLQNAHDGILDSIELFLLVIDGSEPLTADDLECLEKMRELNKPFVIVLNKADKRSFELHAAEIFSKFKADPIEISAESGAGIGELIEAVLEKLPSPPEETAVETESDASARKVLILGRPNVGKSSLLNALSGEHVAFVSPIAGTTRDLLDHKIHQKNMNWIFRDSAGVRKKGKIYGRKADPVEIFSVEKSLKALKSSDLCVFVIEANPEMPVTSQDRKLLHLIRTSMTPTLVLVNKWDKYKKTQSEKDYRNELKYHLKDLHYLPILFVSAQTGFHIQKIYQLLSDIDNRLQKISTSKLNKWLQSTLALRSPRVAKRGRDTARGRTPTQYVHIQYAVQQSSRPMAFQFFTNAPQAVADDDKKFLESRLREHFHLLGVPVKLIFRKKPSRSVDDIAARSTDFKSRGSKTRSNRRERA